MKEGEEAVSMAQLHKLAGDLFLTVDELLVTLRLTRRNARQQNQALKFSPDKSQRIMALKRVYGLAVKLHGGKFSAARWMKSSVPALRGRTPLGCAATHEGLRTVELLLTHFNEVVYSRKPRAS